MTLRGAKSRGVQTLYTHIHIEMMKKEEGVHISASTDRLHKTYQCHPLQKHQPTCHIWLLNVIQSHEKVTSGSLSYPTIAK